MIFKIKEATFNDVNILNEIIKNSFLNVAKKFNLTSENTPKHPSNCKIEWIFSALEKGIHYYLLEIEKKNIPIGCCALEIVNSNIGYLERLAVLPSFRKNGYGTALVKHIINRAKKINIKRIEIGIIAEDVKLRKWYENLGFSIKSKVVFDHLPFEVIFMILDLN
ncbi:MAG: GNAT family N-acetyltransferase [Candidatus Lokiarchaeota archaeon]|nr:GNAT family N-acetyltransferase [Candidatus Lokiarchaeota archaeon]